MKDAAVNRLAKSITQLTLCQVTTSEVDAATKLLDKACQKLQGIQDVPSQRVTDLEAAIRQIRQLSCILDSCTISGRKKPYCFCHIHPTVQACHRKSLMHRYHYAQMMNTIFQLMKTIGKSTSVPESTANPGSFRSEPVWAQCPSSKHLCPVQETTQEYDDRKSTTERTLSAPGGLFHCPFHFSSFSH